MLIDFKAAQIQKFLDLASHIQATPDLYIDFEHVSDFYKALWLKDFPSGTTWYVSGLDDGADEFYISIHFAHCRLNIQCTDQLKVSLIEKFDEIDTSAVINNE